MIFPKYNYKEFSIENIKDWPIKPPGQASWNAMLKEDYEFCKKPSLLSKIHFYLLVKFKIVSISNLPSYHWHWKREVMKGSIKALQQLLIKYKECEKDESLIPIYFNKGASLYTIQDRIHYILKDIDFKL